MKGAVLWLVPIGFSVFPWLFPSISLPWKLVVTVSFLMVSAFIWGCDARCKLRKKEAELLELENRHRAVSSRLDKKRDEVTLYQSAMTSFELVLSIAASSSEEGRIQKIFEYFLSIKKQLIVHGGVSNETAENS